jgi:hypothetical protein
MQRADLFSYLHGMTAVLVSPALSHTRLPHAVYPVSSLIVLLQMFAFCVNLFFNGALFVRMRRMSAEQKKVVWKYQRLFAYLAFSSSLFGALAFGSRWRHLTLTYSVNALLDTINPTNEMLQYAYEQYRARLRWAAAYYVMYPMELWFTLLAKLTVLARLQHFSSTAHQRSRWSACNRVSAAIVLLCMFAGFIGNCVAAVYYIRASDLMGEAAAAFAVNKASLGYNISLLARQEDAVANNCSSVQRFSEMSVLIVVIVTFLVVGVLSSRVISSVLHHLLRAASMLASSAGSRRSAEIRILVRQAKTQGEELQVRVVVTIALIFLTVLLRATVSVFYAVAQTFQDNGNSCSGNRCSPCHNVYSNIQGWILYTPEYVPQQRRHTITRRAASHPSLQVPAHRRAHRIACRAACRPVGHAEHRLGCRCSSAPHFAARREFRLNSKQSFDS